MANANHNPKVFTPGQVADMVDRDARTIQLYCKDGKVDHIRAGRSYIITETGVQQIKDLIKNVKPGRPRKTNGGSQ